MATSFPPNIWALRPSFLHRYPYPLAPLFNTPHHTHHPLYLYSTSSTMPPAAARALILPLSPMAARFAPLLTPTSTSGALWAAAFGARAPPVAAVALLPPVGPPPPGSGPSTAQTTPPAADHPVPAARRSALRPLLLACKARPARKRAEMRLGVFAGVVGAAAAAGTAAAQARSSAEGEPAPRRVAIVRLRRSAQGV